ncbi:D-alanyl-lipoteichoic acid biosynthesis protein DltB [Enterococcus faecalis]|uniref:D-alanyl-lipoteichoic acid biosynthesis protein DltB n=1 Tax=Enterococcus TaxID=1350 RepID=UPI0015E2A8DA|nr:D-alanyl-lipoteichoic acid biosynthesis protein DltB [Enterococcus faecalis]MDN3115197.1 D-alanyl-lipoteichoic acid biosynthesis protein DltB [Enterococcus faecalis]HBC4465829.1 D-alanyl-lipoteichoic acid biosynthesis protein DltB [Enterococcus faecalis]
MMNFPHMVPYYTPFYFVLLIIALIPIILTLMFKGERWSWYQTLITLLFLYISFGGHRWQQGITIIVYTIYQTLLTWTYATYRKNKNKNKIFYLFIFLNILPLILVKISPFMLEKTPIGFLGISYLTFKAVQVNIDLRDGLIKEYYPWHYIQFLLFFPTISSGPIDRYRRFEKDLTSPPNTEKYLDFLDRGIFCLFLGFLYKFIISYYLYELLQYVKEIALAQDGISLWALGYMYVYSLYLFFDVAGYSLFAVGTSYLMGYDTPMNFNKPFLSWNIKEFWNRWHTTLSFWFRDYVYMRLMFFLMKKNMFKSKIVASNIGYFVLFLIMGIWHGLTWYYIMYGVYHATLICLTDAWLRFKKKNRKKIPSNKLTHALAIFLTFHAICISFFIFSGFLDQLWFK